VAPEIDVGTFENPPGQTLEKRTRIKECVVRCERVSGSNPRRALVSTRSDYRGHLFDEAAIEHGPEIEVIARPGVKICQIRVHFARRLLEREASLGPVVQDDPEKRDDLLPAVHKPQLAFMTKAEAALFEFGEKFAKTLRMMKRAVKRRRIGGTEYAHGKTVISLLVGLRLGTQTKRSVPIAYCRRASRVGSQRGIVKCRSCDFGISWIDRL